MRANTTTVDRGVVNRWAMASLNDVIASLGRLNPGSMTTKAPCSALSNASEALEVLREALPHINSDELLHIKAKLSVSLGELAETWVIADCNHTNTPHTASDFFDRLVELELMPGVAGTDSSAAISLLQQILDPTGNLASPAILLDEAPVMRLGAVIGCTKKLTITSPDEYYIVTEGGNAYIREVTFTGGPETRARFDKGALLISSLGFELQYGKPSVTVSAVAERTQGGALFVVIDATKAGAANGHPLP